LNKRAIIKGSRAYIDTDYLANRRASRIEDSLDVIAASLGLGLDIAFNEVAVLVCGDLAGEEDLAVSLDGLGLWFYVSV
jgi:hypothetical protein